MSVHHREGKKPRQCPCTGCSLTLGRREWRESPWKALGKGTCHQLISPSFPTLTLQGTGIISDVLVTQTFEFSIISTAIKSTKPQTSPSGCSTATGQHVKDQTHHHPHRVFPDCPLRVTCWHCRLAFWVTCCAPAFLSVPLSKCTLARRFFL